jgi:hypothetical protein
MPKVSTWIVAPLIVGVLCGAAVRRGVAHACDCVGDDFWTVERAAVESTDPTVDDSAFWPAEGHLYPDRLMLWQERHSVDVEYAP